jgi:hypothetical protein
VVTVKTREQLQAEAQTVRDIIGTAGPYMPERAGIRYHVVSMDWFNRWKAYVEYDKEEESKSKIEDEISREFSQNHTLKEA